MSRLRTTTSARTAPGKGRWNSNDVSNSLWSQALATSRAASIMEDALKIQSRQGVLKTEVAVPWKATKCRLLDLRSFLRLRLFLPSPLRRSRRHSSSHDASLLPLLRTEGYCVSQSSFPLFLRLPVYHHYTPVLQKLGPTLSSRLDGRPTKCQGATSSSAAQVIPVLKLIPPPPSWLLFSVPWLRM